jgi:zinc protease
MKKDMNTKKFLITLSVFVLLAFALAQTSNGQNASTQPAAQQTTKQRPPAGAPPKPFKLPPKQEFTLPNGLRVTFVQYGSTPKVAVRAIVRAGNLNEAADQVWLADLAGDLLKEGTTTRSAEQIALDAARMGGSLDVSVGTDQTSIGGDVLSEYGAEFLSLMADVMRHPSFPASELQRLKTDYVRRLALARSQSQPLATERFYQVLYPNHPYGRLYSTEAMINKFTIDDAKKFYADNFGAARTHIYVVGRFDAKALEQAIRAAFGDWQRGAEPLINIPKPVAPDSPRKIYFINRPGAAQSTLLIGLPAIDPSNPDYIAMQVTNALLGGSFASRITSNIREQKGYTYSPTSFVSVRYRDGFWAEAADVTTAVTGASLKEILYEIDRLAKEPPSEDELTGIKNYLAGIFVLQNSSRGGIVGQLAFLDLHGLDDSYLTNYVQRVYTVTPQDVQRITQKYLQGEKMFIVVVGDKEKVTSQIAPFGEVTN